MDNSLPRTRRLTSVYKEFIRERQFIFVLIVIVFLNLLIIDFFLFSKPPTRTIQIVQSPNTTVALAITPTLTAIPTPATTAVKTVVVNPPAKSSDVKEYYVPLGAGSASSTTWTDVPGMQGYVDRNAYGTLKKVTFEASFYTPTGNQAVSIRLYNVTDQHPVWNSDVSGDGGVSQLKISAPITLDVASKLYSVQMMTQLGALTQIQNARIHILTQ